MKRKRTLNNLLAASFFGFVGAVYFDLIAYEVAVLTSLAYIFACVTDILNIFEEQK